MSVVKTVPSRRVRSSATTLIVLGGLFVAAYFAFDQYRVTRLAGTVRQLFAARHYDQAHALAALALRKARVS